MYIRKNIIFDVAKKKKKSKLKIVIIILIILAVCAVGAFLAWKYFHKDNKPSKVAELQLQQTDETLTTLSPNEIYNKVKPSVVTVIAYEDNSKNTASVGSGVVMDENGYIITASHVVNDSVDTETTVKFMDNSKSRAKIIGVDKQTDLAVLKVRKDNLTPAEFGNSNDVNIGDWVLSLGNPGTDSDIFDYSLTRGIVSSVNRRLSTTKTLMKYIQTDAPISSGSSGGALLNMYGQVVGINALKITNRDIEGISFAAQINQVKDIIDELIDNGAVTSRPKLGISAVYLDEEQAVQYNAQSGLVIGSIYPKSGLSKSEVKVNDIITHIGNTRITSIDNLTDKLLKHDVGDKVRLTVYRRADDMNDAKTFKVKVTLTEDSNPNDSMSF